MRRNQLMRPFRHRRINLRADLLAHQPRQHQAARAPVAPITAADIQGKCQTMVLLTRLKPRMPSVFHIGSRAYWQPSYAVQVSTWDCIQGTDIVAACKHGTRNAKRWF